MLERFSDRARRVMALANQEAQHFHHEYIGTEHILLGILKEGSGVAANVLRLLNVDSRKTQADIERLIRHGSDHSITVGKLPQSPRAKKVIEYAIEETRHLDQNYVGTEHLLVGLMREQDGVAAQVLTSLGLKLDVVRQQIIDVLGQADEAASSTPAAGPPPAPHIVIGPERLQRLQELARQRHKEANELAAEILDDWLKSQS